MNNPNANAITENEYYTDQYMRYADDMVNYYEDEPSYADDGYDLSEPQDRSYGNNNYDDSDYPSYKPDYKQDDRSYGYEDDKYKLKDKERSDNSVSISKINCNSVNYNVIGNVTGDNNIGNDGRAANSNGALGGNAYGNDGERYNDGYQKNKGVSCVITNNNTIITTDNATDGNGDVILTCEECFTTILTEQQLVTLYGTEFEEFLEGQCIGFAQGNATEEALRTFLAAASIPETTIDAIIACLIDVGIEFQDM
jgi:hypothetical protein